MRPFLVLLIVVMTAASNRAQPRQKPNIIIILADDLGYGDLGGFGSQNKTPNIDKLQREGITFTNFYSQPQCSPSRAALMTGCYPQRVGIPWVVGPEGPAWTNDKSFVGLNADEQTLPELLKSAGYATACIGKWHLGHHPQHLPSQHGFDEYFGLPYSNDMRPEGSAEWPALPLIEGVTTIEKNPDQRLLTKRYTERSLQFISKNKDQPFFLYLAHSMPHVPLFVSRDFTGKSGNGLYSDVIQELDWSVGEIISALKKNRIDEQTLVVFTSDNGPWLTYGNHAGSAGSLREGKATTFEGGVRVPMIARWKGGIEQGKICNELAALFDLLPTLAELVNVTPPANKIDGKSFLPLLLGKPGISRDVHYYFQIDELQAVRKGRWKLHFPHNYEHVARPGVDGARGETINLNIDLSLFDLQNDPAESVNVAADYPAIVNELRSLGNAFRIEISTNKRTAGVSKLDK